jgi:hypothetical protein
MDMLHKRRMTEVLTISLLNLALQINLSALRPALRTMGQPHVVLVIIGLLVDGDLSNDAMKLQNQNATSTCRVEDFSSGVHCAAAFSKMHTSRVANFLTNTNQISDADSSDILIKPYFKLPLFSRQCFA